MRSQPARSAWIWSLSCVLAGAALLVPNPAAASDLAWTRSGPEGGQVQSLAVHPHDASIVFAGTVDGVYRSDDGGQTWSRKSEGIGSRAPRTIIINPQNPDQVFALDWVSWDTELFRSDDGGETWHPVGFWKGHSAGLTSSPTPFVLYLMLEGTVFSSADSGTSWVELTNIPDEAGDFIVHPVQPEFMAVILSTGGIALSEDGGESWADCGEATTQDLHRVLFDPNDPEIIYAHRPEFLYRSLDGCSTWKAYTNPALKNVGFLKADPGRPSTLYADTHWPQMMLVSTDGGRYWRPYGPVADPLSVRDMAFSPTNPGVYYLAAEALDERRGIFRSEDGGVHWEITSTSLFASAIETLSLNPADSTIAYAGAKRFGSYSGHGVFKSLDSGITWSLLEGTEGTGSIVAVDPISPEFVYATAADWGIQKSEDGGRTWFEVWRGWGERRIGGIEVDYHRAGTLFAQIDAHYHDAYRSDDGGETWVKLEPPFDAEVFGIYSDPSSPGVVYAATYQGLFRSSDWGDSWVLISAGLEAPDPAPWYDYPWQNYFVVEELVFDPVDPQLMYAATVVGPFRTTNGGLTWELVRNGMYVCCGSQCGTSGYFTCEGGPLGMAVDPDHRSTVYASTSLGTYRSYNRGEKWELIAGPEQAYVKSIKALGDGLLIGASGTAGVLRLRVQSAPSPRRPSRRVLPQGSSTPKARVGQHHE